MPSIGDKATTLRKGKCELMSTVPSCYGLIIAECHCEFFISLIAGVVERFIWFLFTCFRILYKHFLLFLMNCVGLYCVCASHFNYSAWHDIALWNETPELCLYL